MFFLKGTRATSAMAATTVVRLNISFADSFSMCLLATLTTDVCRARFSQGSTVGALRHGTALFIDVLERSVGMLTIAHTMTSHTSLAGVLFAFDQHFGGLVELEAEADGRLG